MPETFSLKLIPKISEEGRERNLKKKRGGNFTMELDGVGLAREGKNNPKMVKGELGRKGESPGRTPLPGSVWDTKGPGWK